MKKLRQWLSSLAIMAGLVSCARDQYLLSIDTDAVVPSQLREAGGEQYSLSAVIDTVRIDVLSTDGVLLDSCQFFVPDRGNWPLSLGIARREDDQPAQLRIRAFRGRFALSDPAAKLGKQCGGPGTSATGSLTLTEPPRELAIDRLVELPPPRLGIHEAHVRLALTCIGVPPDFANRATCVDNPQQFQAATSLDQDLGDSQIGSSTIAKLVPCDPSMQPVLTAMRTRCIPGGLSIQGDSTLVGIYDPTLDPTPRRIVYLSPFFMDETEFTLARLIAQRKKEPRIPKPAAKDSTDERVFQSKFCTWQEPPVNDSLPVNCLRPDLAELLCLFDHPKGWLPSEAQWEYAAHGAGQQRTFPWGSAPASCCQASLSRGGTDARTQCPGTGVEPVRSHQGLGCVEGGDVSLDGIFDLGGSLGEFTRDAASRYPERCGLPKTGIGTDPTCLPDDESARITKGADWTAGVGSAFAVLRTTATISSLKGFRCVYPGVRQ